MKKTAYMLAMALWLAGCANTPAKKAVPGLKEASGKPPVMFEPAHQYSGRIALKGSLLTAPPLKTMALAVVPFGTDANAIGMEKQKGGVQFQVELESCSEDGCTVESGDITRIIVARSGIADAFPLGFIDHGWKRQGLSSISDKGWLAIPVGADDNSREIWVLDDRFHLRKRITHQIREASLLRWRGDSLFIVFQGPDSKIQARRVNLDTGRILSASPIDPWWPACQEPSASPYSAGWDGENPLGFEGKLVIPIWRRGESQPVALEMNDTVRPMSQNGLAAPQKVAFDCEGRICIVTALGEDIWCMRFTPDGAIEAMSRIANNIAGNARGIQIDRRGRFYFLETIMAEDAPAKIHLIRLE